MGETRFQKKRRRTAEFVAGWFPKRADAIMHEHEHRNKKVEKRKRMQFRHLKEKQP